MVHTESHIYPLNIYKNLYKEFIMKLYEYLEELLNYSIKNDLIDIADINYFRNKLYYFFKVDFSNNNNSSLYINLDINTIIQVLSIYCQDNNLLNNEQDIDTIQSYIINLVTPIPSIIMNKFYDLLTNNGASTATKYFYKLSLDSLYIKSKNTNSNWKLNTQYGELIITINTIKPEKNPFCIISSSLSNNNDYPQCVLCKENLGFSGNATIDPKFNLRIIPLTLNNEKWFFQYSPYLYYQEHSIIFSNEHRKMQMNHNTFNALFDFVDIFEHYFIGANAELPIIGGSILNHDHFQAGNFIFPIEQAQIKYTIKLKKPIQAAILNWPLTTIKLIGDRENVLSSLNLIHNTWKNYSNKLINILNFSTVNHNSINPIVRKNNINEYTVYIILRNNVVNEQFPYGIFHPHEKLHHIKKENIGLIEAMGLAILPGRLNNEIKQIINLLKDNNKIDQSETSILYKHKEWINELYSMQHTSDLEALIKESLVSKYEQILECCQVFKNNNEGLTSLYQFIENIEGKLHL